MAEFSFEHVRGGISITQYNGSDAEVVVPSVMRQNDVVAIGDGHYMSMTQRSFSKSHMSTVVLPEGIRCIGWGAFSNCN